VAVYVKNHKYDVIIVGSGPNALAAGICLARENLSVLILEANDMIGGRSAFGRIDPARLYA
jgi:phytoene dehydrogenase-like protein